MEDGNCPKLHWERAGTALLRLHRRNPSAESRNRVIEHYFDVVRSAASRVAARLGGAVRADELIAAGIFGLIDAIHGFDESREVKFTTFAALRVRGAILDDLRAMDPAPRHVRTRARRLHAAAQQLLSEMGRPPSDEELASHLRLNSTELTRWMRDARLVAMRSLGISRSDHDDSPKAGAALPADPRAVDPLRDAQRRMLRQILTRSLSRAERLAVTLYYYEDLSMPEIGRVLDLSESRVSQMLTSVRARLRASAERSRPGTAEELAA
jgi:RNA polymerase sigma factor for flagellar operon FliA